VNREDLLAEAYKNLEWALFSKGKFGINGSIQRKVRYLSELHNIEREDLLHDIFEEFISKNICEKAMKATGQLSTFMTHYANNILRNKLKKCKRLNRKRISLTDNYDDTFDQKWRYSILYLERTDLTEGLVERNTPEDLYFEKELYEKMKNFLGKEIAEVLIEMRTRKEEAERRGVNYQTYRKQLYRQTLEFQVYLCSLDNGDYLSTYLYL
jgi:hypothetical protein